MARDEVEDYRNVSIFWLKKHGFLPQYTCWKSGGIKWSNRYGEETSSIGFQVHIRNLEVNAGEAVGGVRFLYKNTSRWSGEVNEMDYEVPLVTTPCNFGGVRYWFECPLVKNGVYCGRRVGVLYGFSKYYGCRYCGDLVYAAQNQSGVFRMTSVNIHDLEEEERQLKRRFYKGKPTRRYLSLMKKWDRYHKQWRIADAYFSGKLRKIKGG